MPFATNQSTRIYWKLDGEPTKPPLVLLSSIGTDMGLWDAAMPYLVPAFRVLRIDNRGHGASDAPGGDYTLSDMAADVAEAMDAAGIDQAYIAGVSLGGMIAMQMALDYPDRIGALAVICSAAEMDSATWRQRIDTVREEGMAAIADIAMGRFLSPDFARSKPLVAAGLRTGLLGMSADGYAGAGAAIRDMTLIDTIAEINAPTMIVTGSADISTPYEPSGRQLVNTIPGARHAQLDCAHLAPVEAPARLAAELRGFFSTDPKATEVTETAADRLFEAGLVNRRRVLGDAWVDASLENRTDFNADFQAMITRIAWHEIWGRPGLEDRTRRLLVLAITASLGRWEEFALHVRSGLAQGGFTKDELKEVLMQSAIYAGVPAANTGFAEAAKIIADLEAAQ